MNELFAGNQEIDASMRNQLQGLKLQLDNLRSSCDKSSKDGEDLLLELTRLSDDITSIRYENDLQKYIDSLEQIKHKEILQLPLIQNLRSQLSLLKSQIRKSSTFDPTNQVSYTQTADKGRHVSSKNAQSVIEDARSGGGLLSKIVTFLDRRASESV